MPSGNRRKPSTRSHENSRLWAGILALALGSAAITTAPVHAATNQTSNSISAPSDPRYTALAQAQSTGTPVTVDSLTTADSQTQALPDGSLATTTTVEPTRMQNAAGAWVSIDPTLVHNADGTVSTTATPNPLTLSGGGTGPVITASDSAGHSMALSLPVTLPTPTLSGASATYANLYPGVNLTVTAQPSGGFSEVFDVQNAATQAQSQSLAFTTQLSGLTLSQASDGSLSAVDQSSGQTVLAAPPAIMWDSATTGAPANDVPDDFETVTNPDSSAAGPGLGAHTGALPVTDSGSTLTLSGNPAHLDTTTPTYPLYLDPTWTEPNQSGGTNNYSEAQAGCPGVANWDDVSQPGVGYNNINGDGNCPGYGAYESFFDLSTANLNSADTIVSSTFKINEVYSAANSCGEGTQTVNIQWTGGIGSSTAWDSRPAVINTIGEPVDHLSLKTDGNSVGTVCSGGVVAAGFNVYNAIVANLKNSHITFGLYGDESGSWESLERFNNNPSVYTIYDIKPNTPTNTAASPAPIDSGGAVDQDCTGDSNTPGYLGITNIGGQHIATLSATLTSSIASAQMYGSFHLWDTGTGDWTGNSSGYVTTGGTVSWQTPALTDGHLYGWDVTSSDQFYSSPTSTSCFFRVDQTPPVNPIVTSSDFPPLGSATSTIKRYGQTGNNSGTVTLASTDPSPNSGTGSGLKGYYYSLDEPAYPGSTTTKYTATSSSSPTITPTHWGTTTLYVQAVDHAGNLSAETQYSFYEPWYPGAKVTPGDVNGDGIPDLVVTTSGGNLAEYAGNSDTTLTPATISPATSSPAGSGHTWSEFQVTHRGSYTNQGVDDLWAYDTQKAADGNNHLYLVTNNSSGLFYGGTSATVDITKTDVLNDSISSCDPASGTCPTTPCITTTSTGSCADYDNTNWNATTQIVAVGDLYTGSTLDAYTPGTTPGDTGNAGLNDLLTVEGGHLWLYQPYWANATVNNQTVAAPTPQYLKDPIELSAADWTGYTLLAPGLVNGKPTLWARNNTSGVIDQYTITFDANGWPSSLGAPTSGTALTIPNAPDLTATAYPAIYAQVLHPTSTTSYPDLITQNANGQLLDYPGAAPNSNGYATFTTPQPLGAPTDPLATAYQDGAGKLHTYTSAGTNTPGLVMSTGSSPATIALPGGGYATAYRSTDSNGDLEIYNSATGTTTSTTEGIHSGTSPSIAVDATGVIQVAFHANNDSLYIYNASTGTTTNTAQGMATGTSPSLAANPAGDIKAVFQANTNNLYQYDVNAAKTTAASLGMQPGTSPAIAAAPDGDFAVVCQANTGDLWLYDTSTNAGTGTTKGMMSTASPAIAANPSGTFGIAWQANTGDLFLWTYDLSGASYVGTTIAMNHTSSPSITAEADNSFHAALQTSAGNLYLYSETTGTGTDTGQAMNTTTSPSIN